MQTSQAIAMAENAYATNLNQYLNTYTDGYEEESLLWDSSFQPYEQKNDFRVDRKDDTWIIGTATPTFYPDCAIIEYLNMQFCYKAIIDDEYNVIVRVVIPDNPYVDEDFIAEIFDNAIEWAKKARIADAAYFKMLEAQETYRILERELYK